MLFLPDQTPDHRDLIWIVSGNEWMVSHHEEIIVRVIFVMNGVRK